MGKTATQVSLVCATSTNIILTTLILVHLVCQMKRWTCLRNLFKFSARTKSQLKITLTGRVRWGKGLWSQFLKCCLILHLKNIRGDRHWNEFINVKYTFPRLESVLSLRPVTLSLDLNTVKPKSRDEGWLYWGLLITVTFVLYISDHAIDHPNQDTFGSAKMLSCKGHWDNGHKPLFSQASYDI